MKISLNILLCIVLLASCKKETVDVQSHSSLKLIPSVNEPKQVSMITSLSGNVLAYVNSGNILVPVVKQELFLLKPTGDVIRTLNLSDTVYQYLNAVPGINGGFFVIATSDNSTAIDYYFIDDYGDISARGEIDVVNGYNLNKPGIAYSQDNNYLVMFQSYGSGYYLWKGDATGTEIFSKKIQTPNANHYGSGLNYGEKFVRLLPLNDTLNIIQGITYDKYDEIVENCYLRAVNQDALRKWYSTNYDSAHSENSAGLFSSADGKIVLFGTKSPGKFMEGFGEVFARVYTTSGVLEKEIVYPQIDATPTMMVNAIASPGGGFLLVGSNNQLPSGGVVSRNRISIMRLNADLSLSWSKSISTEFPAKGFDAVYLQDGTLSLIGLLKDNISRNKLLYIRLDSNGNLIIN